MRRLAVLAVVVLASAGCSTQYFYRDVKVPTIHGDGTPFRAECPVDGSIFAHGSCELPDGVIPAIPGSVYGDAPSKVCTGPDGGMFECPANYEVPEGAEPVG